MTAEEQKLLEVVELLLRSIHEGDLQTYRRLCLPDLSCYETDVAPYRIDVLEFHLDLMSAQQASGGFHGLTRCDILTPRVQLLGDAAVVTYTRLMTFAADGPPRWRAFNETRVFANVEGEWRMAHFHRSEAPAR
jgi:hypothetical protein